MAAAIGLRSESDGDGLRRLAWSTEGLLAHGDLGYPSGTVAARELLSAAAAPSAIVASNDQMALATLEFARESGINVPTDLSLISFDDTPIVRFAHPPLTAIVQPIAEVSARAVELIIAEQSGIAEHVDTPIVVPATVVIRASTVPPRTDRR